MSCDTKVFLMHANLLLSCLTLCDPVDCTQSGSSVNGIDYLSNNTAVGCHEEIAINCTRVLEESHVLCIRALQNFYILLDLARDRKSNYSISNVARVSCYG